MVKVNKKLRRQFLREQRILTCVFWNCGSEFHSEKLFRIHSKSHIAPLRCKTCHGAFECKSQFEIHLKDDGNCPGLRWVYPGAAPPPSSDEEVTSEEESDAEEPGPEKTHISIVVIGHINCGKSTTTGHFLHKLGVIGKCDIERLEAEAALINKRSSKYAWVLDELKAEHKRGITILISVCEFETTRYRCTVIDAPGHRDFIKHMITGTAQADCALLMIDSTKSGFEAGISKDGQTREHALLAKVLGVKQMICCCNKMDLVKYSKERFDAVVKAVSCCLGKAGYEPTEILFVPVSGLKGDNLIEPCEDLEEWYGGPTLLEAIDSLQEPKRASEQPLRLPLQGAYSFGSGGICVVGRIEAGAVKSGMALTFGPAGLKTNLKSFEMQRREEVQEAVAGEVVRFTVKMLSTKLKGLKRGDVCSNSKEDPAKRAVSFVADIFILNHPGQIREGYSPVMHCHSSRVQVRVDEILSSNEKEGGGELEKKPPFLKRGQRGRVKMTPTKPLVVEAFSAYPRLGRIVLRNMKKTVAVGVVESVERVGGSA